MGKKEHYPFWYGGLASMVAATCTHPLDLAKVRMQTSATKNVSMVGTLWNVIRHEGPLKIYQGLSASLLRQATYSTTRFGVYEYLKECVSQDHNHTPPMYVLLPLSMVSGWIGGMVGNPADIANIRMQNDRSLPEAQRRNYKNVFDALRRMGADEGPKSFFRGLVPNCSRGVFMTASQVVTYDVFKRFLVEQVGLDEAKRTTHFQASLLAGLVATTVCSPVDVVKTRIMNSHNHESAIAIMKTAIRNEGIMVMFRGWIPSFVRMGPQTIVTFLVLEQLKHSGIGARHH
ncbi:mitochondrial dicarboxylate transporter [Trichomonascus vanleenenianus]|uniref:Dic1p n=1 Tax=Trichomonascus vanleenenianus TaxID=2268995 RepID=UPI003EC95E0B